MGVPGLVAVVGYISPQGHSYVNAVFKLTVSALTGARAQVLCPILAV